jgi:hypothetical protein
MNIIKFILALIGLVVLGVVAMWVLGFVWSILWYLLVLGAIGAVGYGGWKLFRKIEDKALGADPHHGLGSGSDINMSWDEYERKYLQK